MVTANGGISAPNANALTLGSITGNNRVLYANTAGIVNGVAATSTNNLCLLSGLNAAAPSWQTCPSGGGGTPFVQNGNAFAALAKFGTTDSNDISFITNNVEHMRLNTSGNLYIGTGYTSALGTLDVRTQNPGLATVNVQGSNNSGFAGLVVNQTGAGDIFSGQNNSTVNFLVTNTGKLTIGTATNGLIIDPVTPSNTGYTGNARLSKTITLSPEYAGAVLTAFGSSTTDGSMTSDASSSGSILPPSFAGQTYYEWESNGLNSADYTVAVKINLPSDFSSWATPTISACPCFLQ